MHSYYPFTMFFYFFIFFLVFILILTIIFSYFLINFIRIIIDVTVFNAQKRMPIVTCLKASMDSNLMKMFLLLMSFWIKQALTHLKRSLTHFILSKSMISKWQNLKKRIAESMCNQRKTKQHK